MALTREFKEAMLTRVQADAKFRNTLRKEDFETMLTGDMDSGKAILRGYIRATAGFEQLGAETGSSPKSLIRMFGPTTNPYARNLFSVISYLQRHAALTLLQVTTRPQ